MNRFFKLTIVFLAFVTFATQVVSIYLSNTMSLGSIEATVLRAHADELSETNMRLQSQLLALSSYNAISSRAGELGYQKNPEFISLYDPVEVARTR